jgi:hypothetical protein
MCAPLAVVGAGVAAAGTLIQGVQALAAGNYQQKVARANASMEAEGARDSITQGRDDALQFYRQIGQAKGSQVAALAANGIDPSFGSALRLQEDTASLAREDAARLYKNTDERTKGYLIRAQNDFAEGRAAKSAGVSAFAGSLFQAAGSLMGGFEQQSALKAKLGTVSRGDVRGMIKNYPGVF